MLKIIYICTNNGHLEQIVEGKKRVNLEMSYEAETVHMNHPLPIELYLFQPRKITRASVDN